jgi:cell division protein FtsB
MAAPTPKNPRDLDPTPTFLRARTGSAKGKPETAKPVARRANRPSAKNTSKAQGPADVTATLDEGGKPRFDPAALPLPSLSRRRLATVAGIVVAAWLVLAFGRQVGDATAASNRADDLRVANAALRQDVSTLQQDLARVQDDRFIRLQGREFGLGGPGEIPFTLAADAPALAADAPGSAAVRLGAIHDRRSPFEVWLSTIFGG